VDGVVRKLAIPIGDTVETTEAILNQFECASLWVRVRVSDWNIVKLTSRGQEGNRICDTVYYT
jgi:hypothetical protein